MSAEPASAPALRLNLGSGGKQVPGFVGVDVSGRFGPVDVKAHLAHLPYDDGSVDEAMAIHVLEHFHLWEAPEVVGEWHRVLKPGAELAVECPDLDKIVAMMARGVTDPYLTTFGLYGDLPTRDPLMVHKWCYNRPTLEGLLREVGFSEVRHEAPRYHRPERDLRVVGVK